MSQTHFRKIMNETVHHFADYIEELLPEEIIKRNHLVPLNIAIRDIQFPKTFECLKDAKSRLVYDELFILETAMALRRSGIKEETGIAFKSARM